MEFPQWLEGNEACEDFGKKNCHYCCDGKGALTMSSESEFQNQFGKKLGMPAWQKR